MKLYWRIVTRDQDQNEAEALSRAILERLPGARLHHLEPYSKFENAFSMVIWQDLQARHFRDSVQEMLASAARIAMPWGWVNFIPDEHFELIFNRDDHSRFTNPAFRPAFWMHVELNVSESA